MNNKEKAELYLRHKYLYYCVGKPIISDYEFDLFENELKDSGDPLLLKVIDLVDFPTIRVIKELGLNVSNIVDKGDKSLSEVKIQHLVDMLSLQKIQINDEDNMPFKEVELFLKKIKAEYIEATGKYDGSGMECIYRYHDGKHILSESNTRGDKKFGFSKMDKMVHIVPTELKNTEMFENKTILIRGEIIMNEELWKSKFSDPNKIDNSRNFIAGLFNRVEFNVAELKMVTYVAYIFWIK
jgi:NAD-dependent DNA ligase